MSLNIIRRKSCCRGITLVELLVVLGIVAVMFSLLLPAISGARRAAMGVACMNVTVATGASCVG